MRRELEELARKREAEPGVIRSSASELEKFLMGTASAEKVMAVRLCQHFPSGIHSSKAKTKPVLASFRERAEPAFCSTGQVLINWLDLDDSRIGWSEEPELFALTLDLYSLTVEPPIDLLKVFEGIGKEFQLSEPECWFLLFLYIVLRADAPRDIFFNQTFWLDSSELLFGIKGDELLSLLTEQGALVKSGLLSMGEENQLARSYSSCWCDPTVTMMEQIQISYYLLHCLTHHIKPTKQGLLATVVTMAPPSHLKRSDFSYLKLDLLAQHLKASLTNCDRGVNVLLYGEPGTGKTELSRYLAKSLKCKLYDVGGNRGSGKARDLLYLEGSERLSTIRSALTLLEQYSERALLCVDECEEILAYHNSKFVLNQLLETNPLPVIWIANSIQCVKPSVLRRMDLVLEVPLPPSRVKNRIFKNYLKPYQVSPNFLNQLAECEDLSSAHISSVCNVLDSLEATSEQAEEVLHEVLSQKLSAAGLDYSPQGYRSELSYQTHYASLKGDSLEELESALVHSQEGRILMSGPPGCGKTGFAYHLAKQLDMPIISVTASAILDKYVGESEKAIAGLFKRAHEEEAILLFDEVDSFLSNRAGHHRSYETTQVNEFLSRMERFTGILIATTNRLDSLDPAVHRRFAFKLQMGYLSTTQIESLFKKLTGKRSLSKQLRAELNKLKHLTPGDFSVVARKIRIRGSMSPEECLSALKKEQQSKPAQGRGIGFVG